jgi:hypothetical protein
VNTPSLELIGARLYFRGAPFGAKDRLKALGAHWDAEEHCWWIGRAKRAEAERLLGELTVAPASPQDDTVPDDARVYARVKHGGRSWYVVAEAHAQGRCRIVGLDGRSPRWVDMSACELLKTYEGREERGAYGRRTGRTVYQTLGRLRDFVAEQRAAEERGDPVCPECGKRARPEELVRDLEDGIYKHPWCTDMPPDGY